LPTRHPWDTLDPMDTKERILETVRKLANISDSTGLTTNHMAEKLSMSPGNLYYHFKNREEIYRGIFQQMYRKELEICGRFPEARDKEAVLLLYGELVEHMWTYRFLHLDITALGTRDRQLYDDYSRLVSATLKDIRRTVIDQMNAGAPFRPDRIDNYVQLTGQILFGWPRYLEVQNHAQRLDNFLPKQAKAIVLTMLEDAIELLVDGSAVLQD
jgi:AcrR family transcriptional regulator